MADKGLSYIDSEEKFYNFMANLYINNRGDLLSFKEWVESFCKDYDFMQKTIKNHVFNDPMKLKKYINEDFIPEEYPTFIVFDLEDTADFTYGWFIVPVKDLDIIQIKSRNGDNTLYFEDL
jgi:hypothetical protein